MTLTIDGKSVRARKTDKNLLEVASRARMVIPCACYRSGKAKGCCRACVVMVNGHRRYACVIAPAEGMQVTVTRADLQALRRQRLAAYRQGTGSARRCCC